MATYTIPFEENLRGWFEIEADSIEEAKTILEEGSAEVDYARFYKDGTTNWDEADIQLATKESN
jgi:hypothetical protein